MSSTTLIIGSGSAGLSAATTLAQHDHRVVLVDRRSGPGGQAADWFCKATDRCQRCGGCLLHDLTARAQDDRIQHLYGAEVTAVTGAAGDFRVTLRATGSSPEGDAVPGSVEADNIVLATGFVPFDPADGRPLGHGELAPVVTTAELNRALRADKLDGIGFAGGEHKRIGFLQCVGSRDPAAGRGYCSQVCCQAALRSAGGLLHRHPDWEITIFYIDLQVYGKAARRRFAELAPRLRLVQGVPAEVQPAADGAVAVVFQDAAGNVVREELDGVVLAVGMVPAPGTAALGDTLGVSSTVGGFLDPTTAPAGVYVAGACTGPTSIEGSALAGRRVAEQLLLEQGAAPATCAAGVCVLGGGEDGRTLAAALTARGVPVTLVALTDADRTGCEGLAGGDRLITAIAAPGIRRLEGQLGAFRIGLAGEPPDRILDAGAVVLAPGRRLTADPGALDGIPHTALSEFSALLGEAPPERVALWLDPPGPQWSPPWRPAAQTTLDAALQAAEAGWSDVTVLYYHLALPGLHSQECYDDAREAGVRFLRQTSAPRRIDGDDKALLVSDAAVPEQPLRLELDRLVVAERAAPDPPLVELAARCGIGLDAEGFAQRENVRLFPLGTERPGIWVLGHCRSECLADELATEASSLAGEVRSVLQDAALLEREPSATIDPRRCVHCLTCVRICPHRAIDPRNDEAPLIAGAACQSCGACAASCPGRAITPDGVTAEAAGQTVVIACRNSGLPALRDASLAAEAAVWEVPCGGAVGELDVLRALSSGAERVLLLCCHPDSCAHLDGDRRCATRAAQLAETLHRLGLPASTLQCLTVAPTEGSRLQNLLAAGRDEKGASA